MNTLNFTEMVEGMEASFEVRVKESWMDAFLQISGDCNPLHSDEAYARSLGYNGKVVYGLLTSSFYSTLVGVYLPGRQGLLHELFIQFVKPVYAGDMLSVHGKVKYINSAYRQIELKAWIKNQDNKLVSRARIKAGFSHE